MYAKYPDTFVDEASRDVLEDTDACLEMMFPIDGYEVQADELEDFVTTIRINCPGVSPATYVEWSEGGQVSDAAKEGTTASDVSAPSSMSKMRIPVLAEGGEAEESMEIAVLLKRGSRMWEWTVGREDGSQTHKEYHLLVLPLFEPSISVAFPPPNFEFRADVRPFLVATLLEPADKISKFGMRLRGRLCG